MHENNPTWGFYNRKTGKVVPAYLVLGNDTPATLKDFIAEFHEFNVSNVEIEKVNEGFCIDMVKLLAPIYNPKRNIFCVGKNYSEHIRELDPDERKKVNDAGYPAFFTKATNTVTGPYDSIPLHENLTAEVDYEAELGVIIGKRCSDIKAENAYDYVFGYTIINDVTARDLQKKHLQWFKGKSLDGFCPMGPWIVTKDEIEDPMNLNITCRVNGELRQNSNTCNMIESISSLISNLSKGLTLEPGDILATGTPSGVGMGFNPPKFLKKGDVVRIEIEKIGYIENTAL